jgi:NAD(P)-dependent dehydrogenase (short-subunit alcohol dehydrogenase family)
MKELAGKTAFVTGAASGIGLGIATAFAQAGGRSCSATSRRKRSHRRLES